MAINARLRFDIFRRDNFTCQYCGAKVAQPGCVLEVDHKVPRSKGGSDAPSNLVTACSECNQGKHAGEAWEPNYTYEVEQHAAEIRYHFRDALTFLVEELFGVEDIKAAGEQNYARLLDYPKETVRHVVRWVKSGAFDKHHMLPYTPPPTLYGKVLTVLSFIGHDGTNAIKQRLPESEIIAAEAETRP